MFEASSETSLFRNVGTTATVGDDDFSRLSYYLAVVHDLLDVLDKYDMDLVDFANAAQLPRDRKDALLIAVYENFHPKNLVGKVLFEDTNGAFCKESGNEIFHVSDVKTHIMVKDSIVVAGQERTIKTIMFFKQEWLFRNFHWPLHRNMERVREVCVVKKDGAIGRAVMIGAAAGAVVGLPAAIVGGAIFGIARARFRKKMNDEKRENQI